MIRIRSVRWLMTLWYAGIMTVVLVIFAVALHLEVGRGARREIDRILAFRAGATVESITTYWVTRYAVQDGHSPVERAERLILRDIELGRFTQHLEAWELKTEEAARQHARIVGGDNTVYVASSHLRSLKIPLNSEEFTAGPSARIIYATYLADGKPFRVATRPFLWKGRVLFWVQTVMNLDAVEASLQKQKMTLLIFVPLTVLLTAVCGIWLAGRAMEPVRSLTGKVRRMGLWNMGERVVIPPTGDEVQQLAQTFNGLLDRMEHSFRQFRRFSAAAAHELRTPLAVLRGEIEVILKRSRTNEEYAELLKRLLDTVLDMSETTNLLLSLAHRSEGGEALSWEKVSLLETVRGICDELRVVAEERRVRISLQGQEQAVRGDQRLIERLIANLVVNAVRHSPAEAAVEVGIRSQGDRVIVTVSDQGPGVSADEIEGLFERFFQPLNKEEGAEPHGLGLGLSRWIAEAHGGRLQVAPGPGFRVELEFPAIL